MKEIADHYEGPHRIFLNKNEKNLGLAGHVNKVIELVNSDLVILAAGDDISLPERAQLSWDLLSKNTDCTCVSFSSIVFENEYNNIKRPTKLVNTYKKFTIDQLIQDCTFHINGAARTFRKSIFEMFGPLSPESPTEDSTILLRCLLAGPVMQHNDPMVFYRLHGDNISGSVNKHKIDYMKIYVQYLKDLNKAQDIGLINHETYSMINKSLLNRLKRRTTMAEFFNNDHKFLIFLRLIIFSKVFNKTEKKRYFKIATSYIRLKTKKLYLAAFPWCSL